MKTFATRRRALLAALPTLLAAPGLLRAQAAATASSLPSLPNFPSGGFVLLMRHAQTEPGIGDPPGFKLAVCASQRNLDASGRAYSQQLGARLSSAKLQLDAVKTSAWCRCRDTATLVAAQLSNRPAVQDWPPLNSTFENRAVQPAQSGELLKALKRIATTEPARRELWVSHQVNISALFGQLTSEGIAMGEAFIVRYQDGAAAVLGRLSL